MSRINFVRLFSILVLTFGPSALSASTIIYEVGTCMPGLPSFPTITAALAATPAANVVRICPGTYREQVEITQPVTLEGVTSEDSARVIIAPPLGGLVVNATNDNGQPVAAQLWVNNAPGPVNISDLTTDASGNGSPPGYIAGILYESRRVTVNRVVTRNQSGNGNGIGMYVQRGFGVSPLVTIENSSVLGYDSLGIWLDNVGVSPIFAVITGNEVTTSHTSLESVAGILITGSAVTVTNNLIINRASFVGTEPNRGIFALLASSGAISGNTVIGGAEGIDVEVNGISVTFNKIFESSTGIFLGSLGIVQGTSVAAIQSNTITDSTIGIDFSCLPNQNVHSNIITDTTTALDQVQSAVATRNTYFNVGTIRNRADCR